MVLQQNVMQLFWNDTALQGIDLYESPVVSKEQN